MRFRTRLERWVDRLDLANVIVQLAVGALLVTLLDIHVISLWRR